MSETSRLFPTRRAANAGWIAGTLVIVAILLTGSYLWFRYHP